MMDAGMMNLDADQTSRPGLSEGRSSRRSLVWLLASLLITGTCGCHIMKKKQDRERFEKAQQEFSCGEQMPPAKP
jgi:hypothetical protein